MIFDDLFGAKLAEVLPETQGTIKVVVPPTPTLTAPTVPAAAPAGEDGLTSPMPQSVPASPAIAEIEINLPPVVPDPATAKPGGRGRGRKVQFEEHPEEKVDPFNLSMDYLYKNRRSKILLRKSTGIPAVHHSLPALKLSLAKTNLTPEELRNFHRPKIKFPVGQKIKISNLKKEKRQSKKQQSTEFIRRKSDLTPKEGQLTMVEFTEEYPPVINNAGMGTKIINYYRKRDVQDIPESTYDEGETVTLEPTDESPFLGDIAPGTTVRSFENNMFRAPTTRHAPQSTDFLLIRSKDGKKLHIRDMPPVFTAGQVQPIMEVPAPNSRPANVYVKNRLQVYIYRLFKKNGPQHRLRIADICAAFPTHSETSIRKRLKDCADFQRGGDENGSWTIKENFQMPPEEELRSLVTPEQVCLFESMLAGVQQLQDSGIEKLNFPVSITTAVNQLDTTDEEKRKQLRKALPELEKELHLTPWNLTSNFVAAMQGKAVLQLTGFGAPSRKGDAFSYLKMPQKQPKEKKEKKHSSSKSQVMGTDADLRTLSLDAARKILLKYGIPDEKIQNMSRWTRIGLIRQISSKAAAAGQANDSLSKYARGTRTVHQEQNKFKDSAQEIFDKQLQWIQSQNPLYSDSDEESEDEDELEDLGMDLEDLLSTEPTTKPSAPTTTSSSNSKKRARTEEEQAEEEERQELEKMIQEEMQERKKAKLAASAAAIPVVPQPPATPQDASKLVTAPTPQPVPVESKPKEAKDGSGKPNKSKKLCIRRVITKKNPDGTETKTVEVIKDPALVEQIMAKKKAKEAAQANGTDKSGEKGPKGISDVSNRTAPKKVTRPQLSVEEEEKRIIMRKEKRRLQEQLRRLKKTSEKQKLLKNRLLKGSDDGAVANANAGLVCGACGMSGHMRTNRNCPLFSNTEKLLAKEKTERELKKLKRKQEEEAKAKEEAQIVPKIKLKLSTADLKLISPSPSISSSREQTPEPTHPPSYQPSPALTTPSPSMSAPPVQVKKEGRKIKISGLSQLIKKEPSFASPSPPPTTPSQSNNNNNNKPSGSGLKIRLPKRLISTPMNSEGTATTTSTSTPTTATPTPPPPTVTPTKVAPSSAKTSPSPQPVKVTTKKRTINDIASPPPASPSTSTLRHPSPASSKSKVPSVVSANKKKKVTPTHNNKELAQVLESFLQQIMNNKESYGAFTQPVTREEAPDYRKVIKRPMDVGTMIKKCRQGAYSTVKSFLDDVHLIVDNCRTYNKERFFWVIPYAEALLKEIEGLISQNKVKLADLERRAGRAEPRDDDTDNENEEVDVVK
eukprot:TRINITY_DN3347_c0_g1_i2.p1 TRINITY_DN3347_c0_g1~~TRINITY_DN3347_c0_g1_i2.p1  ORF type:complete len:1297 (-),score=390.85 TRINITY_DN3347_c0_g1_i2:240-4130(-)